MTQLNERQRQIVAVLARTDGPVTGAQLARELGVSIRTAQTEISRINADGSLVRSSNHGYTLSPSANLAKLTGEKSAAADRKRMALAAIVQSLLIEQGPQLDIDDLAETLFVSRATTERLLTDVRSDIADYGLTLTRSHGAIAIAGPEDGKRRLMADLLTHEVAGGKRPELLAAAPGTGDEAFDLDFVSEITARAIRKAGQYVEPGYERGLYANVCIALFRMRSDRHAESVAAGMDAHNRTEHSIAHAICDAYAERWTISPDAGDIAYLTSLLAGQIRPDASTDEPNSDLSPELFSRVERIVTTALESYGIEPARNQALISFALHVRQLQRRAASNQLTDNGMLSNVRHAYPFVFEVSQLVAKGLKDELGLDLGPGELGFVCIHVGMIVGSTDSDRIKIALLTQTYRELAHTLRDQLIGRFGEQANVTAYQRIEDLNDAIERAEVDLVVTTGNEPTDGIACVRVSPFFVADDALAVQREVVRCVERRQARMRATSARYFSADLVFKNDQIATRSSAIAFLAEALKDAGAVGEDFEDSVRRREAAGPTCFMGTFAIPHALEMNAARTQAAVLLSENGIEWDSCRVRVVLMIAVSADDRTRFMTIYDNVVKSLWDADKIDRLVRTADFTDFCNVLFG